MARLNLSGAAMFVFSFVCLVLINAVLWGSGDAYAQEMVTLREGREIQVEMVADSRSSAVGPGDLVTFKLSSDVIANEIVALPKGTEGTISVKAVDTNGMFGAPGFVEYDQGWIDHAGLKIPVKINEPSKVVGDSKRTKGLLYLIVGVFFVKGEEGGLAPGDGFSVIVTQTIQVPEVQLEAPGEN